MPAQFEDSVLGRVVNGRYRLVEVRLRGVFGTVFLAEEFFCRTFVRQVLVKVSRQTGLTTLTAPHFFNDAIRLAQLPADALVEVRPHVPAILDMGLLPQWNGCGFLVMEAGAGTPLLSWQLEGQRPDLTTQLRIFKDLCRTLATLHRHGIVLGELRPDAVVVDAAGIFRLLGLGLASADLRQAVAEAAPELLAHLAPETVEGASGASADVYALGLLFYEWLTGAGPHLTAPWASPSAQTAHHVQRVKLALHFPPPSVFRGEIRQAMPWLDDVVLRCVEYDPSHRFHDAGKLLEALEACQAGGPLPTVKRNDTTGEQRPNAVQMPSRRSHDPVDELIREARCMLARGEFGQAVDRLDIHRPAEWAVVDLSGARILRTLGQVYVRRGDWRSALECLEQLRSVQREQSMLAPAHYAAALTDLMHCYTQLGLHELAEGIRQEARSLVHP